MSFLKLEKKGHVAHVELSRPEKLNALGPEFWDEMVPTFAGIDDDRSIRAVVLTGAGRGFSAGLDLQQMVSRFPIEPGAGPDGARQAELHRLIRDLQAAVTCVERCRVPVVAAIHGHCLGGAVDLACACDVRLAAADATFGVRETRMAMVADLGTLQRLPAIVGTGVARELVFTGRDFDAAYAERIGLVGRVLPDVEALRNAAFELAEEIAANPPLAVEGAKQVMNEAACHQIDRSLEYVATYNAAHLVTQDLGVAVAAFAARKKPEFSGR